jgi:hypothetical protein
MFPVQVRERLPIRRETQAVRVRSAKPDRRVRLPLSHPMLALATNGGSAVFQTAHAGSSPVARSKFGWLAERKGSAVLRRRDREVAQVRVLHHPPSIVGLDHRLITWLPTGLNRFEPGSPHHLNFRHCSLRLAARTLALQAKNAGSSPVGSANTAGSSKGRRRVLSALMMVRVRHPLPTIPI